MKALQSPNQLPAIADLLLHSGDMLLLDRVLFFDEESTIVEYSPQNNAWYADMVGNMPAWVGIELMAQAVATHVGLLKHSENAAIKQGVLLGARSYKASVPSFTSGSKIQIHVFIVYRDDSGLGAYDCLIKHDDTVLASATLKVFEPDDFQSFLQGSPA